MSQLTITLEDNILQAAQEYTRQHGQELNAWVAQLVTEAMQPAADAPSDQPTQGLSARIQRLYGSLKAPADFDYKKELEDGLAEKYGV
ncbi:MAG: hypothetical protein EOO56_22765 [Hymenobacter sp.]|nr:MAG: hypothetical protein EOO56_22765 [Hymenobacter sp.]